MIGSGPIGVIAALLVTFGTLALAVHLLRRIQAVPGTAGRGVPMRVLQRISLSPKHGIALVQIADRVLVCSIGDGGTQLLTELTDASLADALRPAGPGPAFKLPLGLKLPGMGKAAAVLLLLMLPLTARAQATAPAAPPTTAPSATATPTAPGPRQGSMQSPPPAATRGTGSRQGTLPAPAMASRAVSPMPGLVVSGPVPPRVEIKVGEGSNALHLDGAVGIVVFLGFLTLLPALFLLMTSFTRILIVLHFLRSALGTQTTPPGQLLVAISVLLTGVVMNPVLQQAQRTALQPYFQGQITQVEAYSRGVLPFREFMLNNTREKDLTLFTGLSGVRDAASVEDLPTVTIVSAFVTSELRTAFQMGFVIFLPFVVVDVIVASVLMSLGMFMLPPVMISLPFKLLLFVLADGWTLVVQNLVASFR